VGRVGVGRHEGVRGSVRVGCCRAGGRARRGADGGALILLRLRGVVAQASIGVSGGSVAGTRAGGVQGAGCGGVACGL